MNSHFTSQALRFFVLKEQGSIAILAAFLIPILLGFLTFCIDISYLYVQKRQLQVIADASVYEGALVYQKLGSTHVTDAVNHSATLNGLNLKTDQISTNLPSAASNQIDVTATKPAKIFFLPYFRSTAITLKASASIKITSTSTGSDVSLLSLSSSGTGIEVREYAQINTKSNTVQSNSSGSPALYVREYGIINADTVKTTGKYVIDDYGHVNTSNGILAGETAAADPFAKLSAPAISKTCINFSSSIQSTITINPGQYCGSFTFENNAKVTMNPGTYVVYGGSVEIRGNSILSGKNVTLILTGDSSKPAGSWRIRENAQVTLTAPDTGTYAGVVLYTPSSTSTHLFEDNAKLNLSGAIYFPKSNIETKGNTQFNTPSCLKLIANQFLFRGNTIVNLGTCSSSSSKSSKLSFVN